MRPEEIDAWADRKKKREAREKEAVSMAREVGPMIGFDRAYTNENFPKFLVPPASPGLANPSEVDKWLTRNRDRITWEFLWAIHKMAFKAGIAHTKRMAAMKKNEDPKEWVLQQWKDRPDPGQSKRSFGRQYAPLVKKKFPKKASAAVTPETIARDWLPKGKA
jgi:hypothetical protein